MRIILVFILFLLGTRMGTGNGDGNGCGNIIPTPTPTSASVSDSAIRLQYPTQTPISDSEIRFHESQIRKADSLYKNYLPQYNFEEVKAAMEFFDSLRLSMDNGDGNGNGNIIPTPTPTSDSASASDSAIRLQNPILLCAKAHYYHAVGLGLSALPDPSVQTRNADPSVQTHNADPRCRPPSNT